MDVADSQPCISTRGIVAWSLKVYISKVVDRMHTSRTVRSMHGRRSSAGEDLSNRGLLALPSCAYPDLASLAL